MVDDVTMVNAVVFSDIPWASRSVFFFERIDCQAIEYMLCDQPTPSVVSTICPSTYDASSNAEHDNAVRPSSLPDGPPACFACNADDNNLKTNSRSSTDSCLSQLGPESTCHEQELAVD